MTQDKTFWLIPYGSPEARTHAAEMLIKGFDAFVKPDGNEKPDGPPLDGLIWDLGNARAKTLAELEDAHKLIPENVAPRMDTGTMGEKIPLATRMKQAGPTFQYDDGK